MVSNDKSYVEGALSKLVDFVRLVPNTIWSIIRSSYCEIASGYVVRQNVSGA